MDAWRPRTLRSGSLLDVLQARDPVASAKLAQRLSDGERVPDWTDRELAETMPEAGDRALLLASLRPRPLAFFTESLPLPEDWPDAPCAYLQLSAAFAPETHTAELRGWPTAHVDAHHFWAMTDPDTMASTLIELIDA